MSRPAFFRRARAGLTPLLLAVLTLLAVSCGGGGDDDERISGIIHRLILAATADDTGALESFIGELPAGLPVDPPLYPDADLVVSSRQPAPISGLDAIEGQGDVPSPLLYFIVLDSADDRDDVFAFYEAALDEDPWQLESSFSTAQLDTFQFFNVDDADIAGAISIARGGADDRTSILISLQDAGAFREEEPPFELEESLPVPKEFPADIPLYEAATVTSSAFFREPGNESLLLIFLTEDLQDDVIDFYRDALEANGWTVTEGQPIGLETRIQFRDEDGDVQGEVVADRFPRSREFTEVRLQVALNPARTPSQGSATPGPTP